MNDMFSVLTGIIMHAYITFFWTLVVLIPARLLFNAFLGRRPI